MTFALIAAVTLSLVTTNDYTFTTPGTTNLLGIGIGPTPSYAIVRGEDVSFLREAYEERSFALRDQASLSGLQHTNDYVVAGPMNFAHELNVAWYFPESFDPDGGWHDYRFYYRGQNNSYVSEDFRLIAGGYTPVPCTTNWTFQVGDTNDLRTTYLPFADWDTRLTPPVDLKTNATSSVLSIGTITNAYHNLAQTHDIVTAPGILGRGLFGNVSGTNRYQRAYSGNTATYEYTYYEYEGRERSYPSGYRTITPYNYPQEYDYAWTGSAAPLASSQWHLDVSYVSRIGWQQTSSTSFARKTVLDPIKNQEYRVYQTPRQTGTVRAFCPVILTNNVTLCSDIVALAVMGISHKVTETRYSAYAQSDRTVTTSLECGITAKRIELTQTSEATADGEVVFDTDLDVKEVLASAATFYGEPVETVTPVMPAVSTVPASETSANIRDNVIGAHIFDRSVNVEWIRFIFRFKRDFKAKVTGVTE